MNCKMQGEENNLRALMKKNLMKIMNKNIDKRKEDAVYEVKRKSFENQQKENINSEWDKV